MDAMSSLIVTATSGHSCGTITLAPVAKRVPIQSELKIFFASWVNSDTDMPEAANTRIWNNYTSMTLPVQTPVPTLLNREFRSVAFETHSFPLRPGPPMAIPAEKKRCVA